MAVAVGVVAALAVASSAQAAAPGTVHGHGTFSSPTPGTYDGSLITFGDGSATMRVVLGLVDGYGDCVSEQPGMVNSRVFGSTQTGGLAGIWEIDDSGSRLAGAVLRSSPLSVSFFVGGLPASHCGGSFALYRGAGTTTLYLQVNEATGEYAGLTGGGVVRAVGVADGTWVVNVQLDLVAA